MENSIIGTEVEEYRIQEVLGRGGMGVVYGAKDIALSRDVALKRIDPSLAHDEAFLRRFRSEARALARIDSSHIVSVYALRQTEIGLLIVMEYVEGGTLKDLTRDGPMDWREALPYVKQMLLALEHAHGAEVIHRDIKPRNIMLSAEGTVKVTDFGLAKMYRPDSDETVTEGVHGTLNYMSPEQVQGGANLDHRSDLYSLGMTVYEMLAGELPLDEDSSEFAKMRIIVEEELPPPDELRPQVPDGLSALVTKALEKDPDDRFQSAEVMREAFEAFEEKQGGEAPPSPSPTEPKADSSSSGSGWKRIGGAVVLVLLVAAAAFGLIELLLRDDQTRLSVSTEPASATVSLNGKQVGVTPLTGSINTDTIEGRAAQIRVQRAGYVPIVDTVTQLGDRDTVTLNHRLVVKPTPLTVRTDSAGASVYLGAGDTLIGVTPLESVIGGRQVQRHAEKNGRVRIGIQKEGYRSRDTLIAMAQVDSVGLDVPLEPAEYDLSVRTTPAEAQVALNGKEVGRAPVSRTVKNSTVRVRAEREGYSPVDTSVSLTQSKTQLRLKLEPEPGTLTLSAVPSGTVFVDGESRSSGQSIRVSPGTHRVRFRHSGHEKDATLTVEGGEARTLTCYFTHRVEVQSDPRASVYLNDEDTGEDTEYVDSLGPGTHRIEVRKREPGTWKVTRGEYRRSVGDEQSVQTFSRRVKTLTLEPAFQQETHVIDFQLSDFPPPIATLVDIDDSSVLTEQLDELVAEGQLVEGKGPSDFFEPADCYIFVVDPESEAVEAVLGPRIDGARRNLRSGNTVDSWASQYADKRLIWTQQPTSN